MPSTPLTGGSVNHVRRVGDTVRRVAGPWTPSVHRYLDHLRHNGITEVPRPLAIEGDDEILTWVEGEVPVYPMPDWVWADELLVEGARLLRRLHDATVDLAAGPAAGEPTDAVWQSPVRQPPEVLCHNDFSPHNLAFKTDHAGRHHLVGVIDVDMCAPGPRVWDLGYYATRIVPLDAASAVPDAEVSRRLALLLAAYGTDLGPTEVLAAALAKLHVLLAFTLDLGARTGNDRLLTDAAGYRDDIVHVEGLIARLSPENGPEERE